MLLNRKTTLRAALVATISLATFQHALAQQDPRSGQPEPTLDDLETQHIDLDEIVVVASPLSRALGETISGVSLLEGEELKERLEGSLGETLNSQPGISSTFFGAGASRPIIRGLGGDRIRVLEDGIGTFDAASTSPDHAVPVEPALAQRIEVLRGAASLLYGSSAAGGVVNTDSGKIPSALPEGGIDGAARVSHATVNNAEELAVGLNAALGQTVLHGEYFYRNADVYSIPGISGTSLFIDQLSAEAAENGETFDPSSRFTDGFVNNSDLQSEGGSGGISYILDGPVTGFVGVSASILNSNYGLPQGTFVEGDEDIRIDLEQLRYDLKGEFAGDFGFIETVKVRLGYGDYRHVELEGDEVGTLFENDEIEGRLELVAQQYSLWGGTVRSAFGLQGRSRDFSALGEEAFVPPSTQRQLGLFTLNEYRNGGLLVDLGLRYENVRNQTTGFIADEDADPVDLSNSFDLFSVTGGVGYALSDAVFIGANVYRTERAPALEENFSFGPHLATASFEIGDPSLGIETATGAEATIRGEFGPFTAVLNGFYTSYDNFIAELATDDELDELPVFQFTAVDATFRGLEAEIDLDLGSLRQSGIGEIAFATHAQIDLVRATSSSLVNENLPRIPPVSGLFGLSATSQYISLRGEIEYVAAQNNIADFELPTDDYVFINSFLTIRPFGQRRDLTLEIRGRNLGNSDGRVHTSFLKETTPLPGRDVRFTIRAGF